MTNFFKKYLFSNKLMAILFIVFAVAMALGTFLEHWYSTDTARIYIYNARWFELIMLFFVFNFIGNIKKYNLLQKSKWPVLMLHISWIFIIVGAFVTRYISYEGMMGIREGATENVFMSDRTFLTVRIDGIKDGEKVRKVLQEPVLVTPEGKRSSLPWKTKFNKTPVKIAYKDFIAHAEETLVEKSEGKTYLKIVESSGGNRHDHFIEEGQVVNIHNLLFAFNKFTQGAINVQIKDSVQTFQAPWEGTFMRMADRLEGKVVADSLQPLMLRSLYQIAGMQFVLPSKPIKGIYEVKEIDKSNQTQNDQDALVLDISVEGKTKSIAILGSKGRINAPTEISLGGLDFKINYGSLGYTLPFSVKLNDFIAEKYPGTESSYKSFTSKVTVEDSPKFDYDIFMNHVLDHKGYRFFQASYDSDEKGTRLSVSHDFWGKWITYIGYFLLYIGLMASMFFGNTRFNDLKKQLEKVRKKKSKVIGMLFFITSFSLFGQSSSSHNSHQKPTEAQIDSVFQTLIVDAEHAKKFGALVVQDAGGRMKPLNTFSSELLRKVTRKNKFKGLNSDQVFLAMMLHPSLWYNIELIHLDWKNDSIRRILGIPKGQKYGKALDFFDEKGSYKLKPYLEEAYAAQNQNSFQKDFTKTDQKLGLLNQALSGSLLKVFPLLNDTNNKWVSPVEYNTNQYVQQDSLYSNFIKNAIPYYLVTLRKAKSSGDYSAADKMLAALKENQNKYGKEVMPAEDKIKAEILYNKLDIFNKLFRYYALIGVLLFLLLIFQIFKDRKFIRLLVKGLKYLTYFLFALHLLGLLGRWYISGHAPWSDAYESILYVAFATMAIGIYYGRKSDLTLAATTFVSCMLLFIANQSWVDPAIGNLVPVLDSYWLMIHVAVIVGSYGPFTLGMILGVVCMVLILLANETNKAKIALHIKELTIINEMALTVGLVMLTIGNFLGGMWANESWGRYWGWDPKETWALISIMVYAFVIHMRLIPALRGRWLFGFASVLAFASIMMTYFGVNFYLSGLHSYASGDQVITPSFVWYTVGSLVTLGALSWWRNRKWQF